MLVIVLMRFVLLMGAPPDLIFSPVHAAGKVAARLAVSSAVAFFGNELTLELARRLVAGAEPPARRLTSLVALLALALELHDEDDTAEELRTAFVGDMAPDVKSLARWLDTQIDEVDLEAASLLAAVARELRARCAPAPSAVEEVSPCDA